MTRALVHTGLALAVAFAPALCCCKAGLIGAVAHAAPASGSAAPAPQPVDACCSRAVTAAKSCCHEAEPPLSTARHSSEQRPPAPKPAAPCPCCDERPAAAPAEGKPQVAAAEPTGEFLPPAHLAPAGGGPERSGLFRGLYPPDRAGADARFDALFRRHALRC